MKTARIGTILPWGGDGNEGFTASNIPRGWMVCDGLQANAAEFPLLASEIGNTYGGTMTGNFPNYSGTFSFPKLTNRVMVDMEPSYLNDTHYQHGQGNVTGTIVDSVGTTFGSLIEGFGTSQVIKTTWSADADIDFTFTDPFLTLSGKFTNMKISPPDFSATITTLGRKLGINHTPSHSHPGNFASAQNSFYGPAVFKSVGLAISGNTQHPNCSLIASVNHTCEISNGISNAPSWQQGRALIAYHGDETYENTLPTMDKFYNFVNDSGKDYWSQVPAPDWHTGTPTRNSPTATNQTVNFVGDQYTQAFAWTPDKGHQMPAWTGLMPRPNIFGNRRNFYGHSKGIYNGLQDNPEDPSDFFTVASVPIAVGVSEISLPAGTDIRTSHGTAPNNWYQYDKIHPWMMVDSPSMAKGCHIISIERTGTNDTDWVYTLKLSANTINTAAATETLTFRQGTFATSLSNFGDNNPNSTTFTSHNHGSFDIQMAQGSLNPPATYPLSNISIGSVTPQNLENALNIIVDTDQPAMMIVYLIKAF